MTADTLPTIPAEAAQLLGARQTWRIALPPGFGGEQLKSPKTFADIVRTNGMRMQLYDLVLCVEADGRQGWEATIVGITAPRTEPAGLTLALFKPFNAQARL